MRRRVAELFWIRMLQSGASGPARAFITQVDRIPEPGEPVNYDGVVRTVEQVVQPASSGHDAGVEVSALGE